MSYESSVELAKIFLFNHFKENHKSHHINQVLKPVFKEQEEIILNVPVHKTLQAPPMFGFDLGKLNILINDQLISIIQCDGANIPLKISKDNQMSQIDLVLTEEEIHEIINKFSFRSHQAITEPVFQAEANNLKIMAITSKYAGSRFIITKV